MHSSLFHISILLPALILVPACGDIEPAPDAVELRDDVLVWDDINCLLPGARCYGHRPNAEELWSPLVSECDLQQLIDNEGWVETKDGYTVGCDLDGRPETFPDVRCFWNTFTTTICFGGDNGWYTEVGPACDTGTFTSSTWPTGYCDTDIGIHEYDDVFVSSSSPTTARAFIDGDRFTVVDDCKMTSENAPPNPYCEAFPCCFCDAEGFLTCVAPTELGACPGLSAIGVVECD